MNADEIKQRIEQATGAHGLRVNRTTNALGTDAFFVRMRCPLGIHVIETRLRADRINAYDFLHCSNGEVSFFVDMPADVQSAAPEPTFAVGQRVERCGRWWVRRDDGNERR